MARVFLLCARPAKHGPEDITGDDAKKAEAQAILARRAKENGLAQLGKFVAGDVSESESESTYQKNYGEGYQRCDNFDHSIFKPIPHHLTTVP